MFGASASAGEPAATDDPSRSLPPSLDGLGGDFFSPRATPRRPSRVPSLGGSSVGDASALLAAARVVARALEVSP